VAIILAFNGVTDAQCVVVEDSRAGIRADSCT
jgi:beta-phosphoglucomutase-like phosphatase (HAD superfamily)